MTTPATIAAALRARCEYNKWQSAAQEDGFAHHPRCGEPR